MGFFHFAGDSAGKGLFLSGTSMSHGLMRIALLAAAGLAATAPARAESYWIDDDPMRPSYSYGEVDAPRRAPVKPRHDRVKQQAIKLEKQAKEGAKPVGPLVISISIDQQVMRVYDANGLFAESRVSTGMRGHATPMGVFSVIQKNKWHKSNIYSGAPMPYMQRITWSGIAMHAGALPGYPASHGCIRMPMAFATKLWGWTRMGARVIIAPGDVSPAEIQHPQLIAQKPVPVAAKPVEVKSGDLGLKPAPEVQPAKTQTADATNAIVPPAAKVMSDANAKVTRQDVDAAAAKPLETASVDVANAEPKPTDAKVDAVDVPPPPDTSPKRTGQIAVLISGKDGKLYVRQNFSPLFETPITIKADERPLGTHVFTARVDKDGPKAIHWTAASLPAVTYRKAKDAPQPLPDSPSEALDRVSIPEDAMTQIADAIATGGSIIVSDQSIKAGGETGQGTEFVVPLR